MPGFGHLLRADARQLAPKHGYGRLSWKPTCTNHLQTEYVACVVANSIRRNLPVAVNGRQSFFQAMNAGKRRKPDVRYWSVCLFLSAAARSAASGSPSTEAV